MKRVCMVVLLLGAACGSDRRADAFADADFRDAAFSGDPSQDDAAQGDAATPDGFDSADGATDASVADLDETDASSSVATVELRFAGCAVDLGGDVVVARNAESIAVSSTRGGALTASIQLALQDQRGLVELGTQHRIDTRAVVNVSTSTTWTNLAMDSAAVLRGDINDPIGGTLNIAVYDETAGMLDITFNGVTLQNPANGGICQIEGRLRTRAPSF